jgi:prepilin-type N-terminal cleavage/methylation domain-containing protein
MRRHRGFTLVELMIVVAIIVVLSVIAVGAYRRFTARARTTEVHAMFAEIRAKEESYRAEFSSYYSLSGSETDLYPVLGSAGTEPRAKTWVSPAAWTFMGVRPPSQQIYCGYAVVQAPANSWGATGTYMRSFVGTVPGVNWWAAVAMCDNDSIGGTLYDGNNARFTTSSLTTTVREETAVR